MKMHRPGRTEIYILKQDRESDNPTEFTLRGLTWKEMDEVNKHSPMTISDALTVHSITRQARDEERELTADEIERINKIAPMDHAMTARLNEQHAAACRFGIKNLGVLYDEKNIGFHMEPAEFVENADIIAIRELGGKIIGMSRFSEKAVKN